MADFVLDANAVSEVVTYVAPGFLARMGYRTRFPGPDRPAGEVLILAVVASFPLVAFVTAVLPGTQRPTAFGYVVSLCVVSFAFGYLAALLRRWARVKSVLAKLGYRLEPEQTIWAQTLAEMSPSAEVVVDMKDGRQFRGCPRSGPQHAGDGISELYLVFPEARNDEGGWSSFDSAIIVPLSEITLVTLSEDPTGAQPRQRIGSG